MLLHKQLKDLGDIRGMIYDFEKVGDLLPKHIHDENNNHITIVARGRIKVYSHDWEIEGGAGTIWDFRPNEPHEFMALEDNSRIVNIIKKMHGVVDDNIPPPVVEELQEDKLIDNTEEMKLNVETLYI